MRHVLLWAGLDFVDDGEKDGGVGAVVDFGAGEKSGGERGMWRGSGELWVGGGNCEGGLGGEGWNEGGWFTWGGSRDDWVVLTWKYCMIYLPPPSVVTFTPPYHRSIFEFV